MAKIDTTKHEMVYDTETKQAIFNARNLTVKAPANDPFPKRLVSLPVSIEYEYESYLEDERYFGNISFEKGYIVNRVRVYVKETGELLGDSGEVHIERIDDVESLRYDDVDFVEAYGFYSYQESIITVVLGETDYALEDLIIDISFLKLEGEFTLEM